MFYEFIVLSLWFAAFLGTLSYYLARVNPHDIKVRNLFRGMLLALTLLLPLILILF